MAQIHEPPPNQQTERFERPAYQPGGFEPAGGGPSAGRVVAIALMLVAVTLVAAGISFLLAGGRLPSSTPLPTPAPTVAATNAPAAPPPTVAQAAPTVPPAPAVAPTVAPTAPPQPTTPPPTPAPPTAAPKPTDPPPPTAAPKPTDPPLVKPASAPSAPAAQTGVHVPVRPGIDPRMAQIEGRVNEYFAALREEDYARAQQVCCTPEWRARFPLDRWQRNFNGVSDLRLTGPPRYLQVEDDVVVVETDYTFVSGGARRNFTLRWTFKPVGSEWQADLAEAFPTQ